MKLSTVLAGRTFTFQSVKEVLAKANEEKSGDILAGVAAASGLERVAAKQVLSELLVRDLRENPVVPYEVPPEGLPLAARAVEIPLKMHIGAPCLPLVAPGDSVRAGSSSPSRRKAPWGR